MKRFLKLTLLCLLFVSLIGCDMYTHGSWAASLKYNEADGLYYVAFNSNDHGFFVYTTNDKGRCKYRWFLQALI